MEPAAIELVASQSCPSSQRKVGHPKKTGGVMIRKICIATILVALTASASAASAKNQRAARLDANGNLDALVARHAAANNLPEDLLRRIIKRESGGNPRVVSKGNFGLMQIKLATARSMGYTGTAAGLLDADTNMTYAVKYLAGAYHVAGGNTNRAVHYYAAGYYYAAKSKGRTARTEETGLNAFASTAGDRAQGQHAAQAVGPNVSPASDRFGAGLD
jgi:soluble lytic murein transglycosylase-like protein